MPHLEIALATHNSSRYLPALLDSLFAQSRQDFTLLVADDASSDATLEIVADYRRRYPDRIRLLDFPAPAGGAKANFTRLLNAVTADQVMFCDHDDVWLPHKVAHTLEALPGRDDKTPMLVHTDLVVTDPELRTIAPSFWRYSRTAPSRNALRQLLVQNVVTGCTILANRALYEMARPIPEGCVMHDYWFALVAATHGRIVSLPECTVLYRQHGANTVGAKPWSSVRMLWTAIAGIVTGNDALFRQNARAIAATARQAEALEAQFGAAMTPAQKDLAHAAATMWDGPRLLRYVRLLRRGIAMDGLLRNLGLLIAVTFYNRDRL